MLLTMEMNEERAREARENFARAGLADRVSVIVGDAQRMLAKVSGPFDLIFQDGDKKLYAPLLDRLVELLRPGGLLVTDNVLWDGEVVPGFRRTPKQDAADTRAIADYNERLNAASALDDGDGAAARRRRDFGEACRSRSTRHEARSTSSSRSIFGPAARCLGTRHEGAARRRFQRRRQPRLRSSDADPRARPHRRR